jgi:outer membrane biosynthesis protein TonB
VAKCSNTSILDEELAQLSAQIEQTRKKQGVLEGELRAVDAELETFSADRQRFDALRDVYNALDKLGKLKAGELFWEDVQNAPGHLERVRSRVAQFEGEISGVLQKQASLRRQINGCLDELDLFNEEVRDVYACEERRQEEYAVEREISSYPYQLTIRAESEQRFRKALRTALLVCFLFSLVILLWKLPPSTRPAVAVVPERLVSMLKKEPPKPEPPRPKEEKPDQEKKPEKAKEDRPKPTTVEKEAARQKAESSGVLAFKEAFKDLMAETPAAQLGSEARLNNQSATGQARSSRSLIAMQSAGGSGGSVANAAVSRNVGGSGSGIGGVGFTRVQSAVAGLTEGARPLSSGPGPSRTDEEIQIVFDKYKATLYRIYNTELRKNPTLRGKIILRITIESGGEVSACTVQSSELTSPTLVEQIVERVKKFNFGAKEKVSKTTILYPIDFLPGG